MLMSAAALAFAGAAVFFIAVPRRPAPDAVVTPPKVTRAGAPMPAMPTRGPGSAGAGVRRILIARLGHPADLRLQDVRQGRYGHGVRVTCGFYSSADVASAPFILAGRSLTTADRARGLAARIRGCEHLRQGGSIRSR